VTASHIAAGFGLGVALAGAPGPVQAVILGEAIRGGVTRGLRAMAGANLTFGVLLLSLALGLSVAAPGGTALRILKVVGGAFLLWLAAEGLRSARDLEADSIRRRTLPSTARGSLAVLLNPGAWIFMAAVASPLFATASNVDGTAGAILAAIAMVVGVGLGDVGVAILGGAGIRRAGARISLWVRRALALVLAGLGLWLIVSGAIPS
jgi:threonine/homoserine/homoserine lactone efflux protein